MLEPKAGKLVSKFKLKLEKFIYLELFLCSNSEFSSLMKLKVDEIMSSRDAAGHYPTRATRPMTRPVLNRPNYPYYP